MKNFHLQAQRGIQYHRELVVHVAEKVERHDEVPVLVRLGYVFQLLRKRRPEHVVRKVQAPCEAVQLAHLELPRVRKLARVEDELHKFFLGHEAEREASEHPRGAIHLPRNRVGVQAVTCPQYLPHREQVCWVG